jgi:tRNA pseudouridine55 synthase
MFSTDLYIVIFVLYSYSALRIQGKRLYDYARNGIALPEPIQPRQVYIESLELVNFDQDTCVLRVVCGGGTYMRSLVHDMANSMGTYGHMTALERTRQGRFSVRDALVLNTACFNVEKVKSAIV